MNPMPIDLADCGLALCRRAGAVRLYRHLIGNLLSFNHRGMAAVLSALVFAGLFVFWTYYPHHLPLPTAVTVQKAAVDAGRPAAPAAPAAPVRPRNPVTDITPPAQR